MLGEWSGVERYGAYQLLYLFFSLDSPAHDRTFTSIRGCDSGWAYSKYKILRTLHPSPRSLLFLLSVIPLLCETIRVVISHYRDYRIHCASSLKHIYDPSRWPPPMRALLVCDETIIYALDDG
jgi:hypothetical protein